MGVDGALALYGYHDVSFKALPRTTERQRENGERILTYTAKQVILQIELDPGGAVRLDSLEDLVFVVWYTPLVR